MEVLDGRINKNPHDESPSTSKHNHPYSSSSIDTVTPSGTEEPPSLMATFMALAHHLSEIEAKMNIAYRGAFNAVAVERKCIVRGCEVRIFENVFGLTRRWHDTW